LNTEQHSAEIQEFGGLEFLPAPVFQPFQNLTVCPIFHLLHQLRIIRHAIEAGGIIQNNDYIESAQLILAI
jgi:hypothetical protein